MPKLEQHQPEVQVGLRAKGSELTPEWLERRGGERENVTDVLASWAEGGQGPGQRGWPNRLNRTFFRLRTERGAVYEIAHELPQSRKSAARWVLIRQLQDEPAAEAGSRAAEKPVSGNKSEQSQPPARHRRVAVNKSSSSAKSATPRAKQQGKASAPKQTSTPRTRKAGR